MGHDDLVRLLDPAPEDKERARRAVTAAVDMFKAAHAKSVPKGTDRDRYLGQIQGAARRLKNKLDEAPAYVKAELWAGGMDLPGARYTLPKAENDLSPPETPFQPGGLDRITETLERLETAAAGARMEPREKHADHALGTSVYKAVTVFGRFRPHDVSKYNYGPLADFVHGCYEAATGRESKDMKQLISPAVDRYKRAQKSA